ncbi:MAG: glycosyltransferase family 4 protein [Gammaproteobacteria bacterium]|nr:glycosyltransferase family 4 protein [Gammaproteobacteria bacterium]
MKKVVICQHRLLHYRMGLFERLRAVCAKRGIELHLVHGQASRRESVKKDEGSLPWAHKVKNRFWEMGARDLVWQPFPADLHDADLVVVMQENRILSNYPLLLARLWSPRRVAYWGHGVNFQSDAPAGLREKWKQTLLNRVDWWFAYTGMTVDILRRAGYPQKRITCLDNAIDNEAFERDLAGVTDAQLQEMRVEIDAPVGAPIGLFCGSLYPDKRLDYMIEAADRIHAALPAFRLVVIGDGPSAVEIRAAAETRPWLKWLGVRKGQEKAAWFKLADVVINPGLVGLHILDSFCSGTPMITTAESRHSPEIAYLRDGVNGLVVHGEAARYADAVIALFNDRPKLEAIKQAALRDAEHYTLDNMVKRFAEGIELCVAMSKK